VGENSVDTQKKISRGPGLVADLRQGSNFIILKLRLSVSQEENNPQKL
jgi:hypothetical protein